MSLLQPNKVQSIFFLFQFRVRSVAICLPFFLSINTCHLFLSARLFHLSSSTVLRHSCDNRGNPITSWSILKQIACPRRGHMDWCLGVPRLFLPPPPPPCDVMSRLALWRVSRWVEKKTQSFGFNLILFLQWKTTCKQDVSVVEMLTCSRAFLAINFF